MIGRKCVTPACIVSFESNRLGTAPGHAPIVNGPAEADNLLWQTDITYQSRDEYIQQPGKAEH